MSDRDEALSVAYLSLFFYLLVASLAFWNYRKFLNIEKANAGVSLSVYYRNNIGRYDDAKKLFFRILTMSAILDLPVYIGCLITDGPEECEWNNISFMLCWFSHMIALCGYALCIVIPCVLWSDMINKRDGKLFFSSFPYDNVKIFFRVLISTYFINTAVNLVSAMVSYRASNPNYFKETQLYSICAVCECVLIFFISLGCLYCGIKLQCYVHKAKLNPVLERKFLFSLNVVLIIVVLSFLGRAILVLEFASFMPSTWQEGSTTYALYTALSRWMPDVFCQFCLILLMRTPSSEIARKTLPPPGTNKNPQEESLLDGNQRPSNGTASSFRDFDLFSIFFSGKKKKRRESSKSANGDLIISNPISNSVASSVAGDDLDTNISVKEDSFAFSAVESNDGESYQSMSTVERGEYYDHLTILTNAASSKPTVDLNDLRPHPSRHSITSSYGGAKHSTSADSSRVVIGENLSFAQQLGSPIFLSTTPPKTSVEKMINS